MPMHPQSPRKFLLNPLELGEVELREIVRRTESPETLFPLAIRILDGAEQCLPGADHELTQALIAEPHFLGWLHQHLGERKRFQGFEEHTRDEKKHDDPSSTTQLFTPRWLADSLARELYDVAGPATLLDPACGGGQMLLAWIDCLIANGVPAAEAFQMVRGVELDPDAANVSFEVLRRHAQRHGVEAIPRIQVADALFDTIEPADLVLTNPPYMGARSMPAALKTRLMADFAPYHHDLYTAFIDRSHELARVAIGVLAQQTVWYLSRFEKARRALLERGAVVWFAHLGPHVFRSLNGEKANVVAFVQRTEPGDELTQVADVRALPVDAKRETIERRETNAKDFRQFLTIPGAPIAHWLRTPLAARFRDEARLGDLFDVPGSQNKTGANARFVRPWHEVDAALIRGAEALHDGPEDGRWVFYSKGGAFAPWWGNWNFVVDWSEVAQAFYASNKTSNLLDQTWRERPGLTYSDFGGQRFAARWLPRGALFDMAGPAIFQPEDDEELLQGLCVLLNSGAARELLNAMNPSIHYQVRDLRNLPLPRGFSNSMLRRLAARGADLITSARALHSAVSDDPLEAPEADQNWRETFDTYRARECEAMAEVHELYEIKAETPPIHHAFERILRGLP